MSNQTTNPITYFVDQVKEFAVVKDPEIKRALFKLADVVASDSILADYDPSSDALQAEEDLKVEIGELEARMLAETEAEVDAEVKKEEEEEVPLEIEIEEDDVPLTLEDET